MQKTRSISLLRELIENLEQEENWDVSFREKDLHILNEQCQQKYQKLSQLVSEKQRLDRKLLELKEQLCEINPEALEQIERDCEQKPHEVSEQAEGKEKSHPPVNKPIKKKSDRKKRKKERLYYD